VKIKQCKEIKQEKSQTPEMPIAFLYQYPMLQTVENGNKNNKKTPVPAEIKPAVGNMVMIDEIMRLKKYSQV